MGFSTYIAAKMFLDTMNTPNTQSIIIAQDETNSRKLFQMVRRFYDNLAPHVKRIAETDSKVELYWKDIDSYFFVGWAGSKKVGRGGTVNNVHASEVAFWENAGQIVSGLMESVPADGNIFLESTANGVDNYYYKEYKDAENGESVYTARFYNWTLDPGYSASKLANGQPFVAEPDELDIQERHELTTEQLIWRRNKILALKNARMGGDDTVGDFPQEYPLTPQEAFLSSGMSFFDKNFINNQIVPNVSPPLGTSASNRFIRLNAIHGSREGRFFWWKHPETEHRYLIIADPAEGINNEGDHDYCGAHVIDMETWEQVAVLHGRWEPNEFAHLLAELGWWYNYALIAVERNNHGHSVLNSLINHIEYVGKGNWGGVYYHQEWETRNKKVKVPGFPTNVKTKATALGFLKELIEDESIKINCKRTADQLLLFSKLKGGKYGASVGHDDLVTALMIGAFIMKDTVFMKKLTRKESKSRKILPSLSKKGKML